MNIILNPYQQTYDGFVWRLKFLILSLWTHEPIFKPRLVLYYGVHKAGPERKKCQV